MRAHAEVLAREDLRGEARRAAPRYARRRFCFFARAQRAYMKKSARKDMRARAMRAARAMLLALMMI